MSRKTEFLVEAFKLIKDFEGLQLPEQVSADKSSTRANIYEKVELYYRIVSVWSGNLGKVTYELFFTAKPLPALIITREIVLQAAIFFGFVYALEKAVQTGHYSDVEREVNRLLLHNRSDKSGSPEGNVRNFLALVNDRFTGFRDSFERLGDCILPSRKGFEMLDGGVDLKSLQIEHFLTTDESAYEIGVKNLVSGFVVLNFSFNKLLAIHSQFARACKVPLGLN